VLTKARRTVGNVLVALTVIGLGFAILKAGSLETFKGATSAFYSAGIAAILMGVLIGVVPFMGIEQLKSLGELKNIIFQPKKE
jgi:hypothetical protein